MKTFKTWVESQQASLKEEIKSKTELLARVIRERAEKAGYRINDATFYSRDDLPKDWEVGFEGEAMILGEPGVTKFTCGISVVTNGMFMPWCATQDRLGNWTKNFDSSSTRHYSQFSSNLASLDEVTRELIEEGIKKWELKMPIFGRNQPSPYLVFDAMGRLGLFKNEDLSDPNPKAVNDLPDKLHAELVDLYRKFDYLPMWHAFKPALLDPSRDANLGP